VISDVKRIDEPKGITLYVGLIVTLSLWITVNCMVSLIECWAGDVVAIASHVEGKKGYEFIVTVKLVVAIPEALVWEVVVSSEKPCGLFTSKATKTDCTGT
jgi:hypothetical protein